MYYGSQLVSFWITSKYEGDLNMKRRLKAILILGLIGVMLTGQIASATELGNEGEVVSENTYYVSSYEEEVIEFNRGMATNKPFTLEYANGDSEGLDYYNAAEGVQDYANSHYAYYNFRAYDFYEETDEDSDILRVTFSWYGKETPEETDYVYNFVRELIKSNPSIITASDYEKTKWAYNWMCSNVTYDYTYKNYSAYKGLTSETVCDGYSKLFYVFATELGLDCFIVSGVANGLNGWGGHAWNLVKMEDNKWYVVDTTWGATGHVDWLLKGNTYTTKDHKMGSWLIDLFDIPDGDYINTGNSTQRGVLGSVFGVEFDTLKKYILGEGEQLTWLINKPDDIELTFTSEDESIATISEDGIITAVAEGITTLKVVNEELGLEQRFVAVVKGVYDKGVKAKDISVKYGKKADIKIETAFGETIDNITYESLDKSIATVDKNGKVKSIRAGTTEIKVTYDDGESVLVKVTVKPIINSELKDVTVGKGKKVSLREAAKVSKKGYKDLTFKTSNKKVATVSKTGYVTGKASGECKIKIYDKLTNKEVCEVNVIVTDYKTININDLVK